MTMRGFLPRAVSVSRQFVFSDDDSRCAGFQNVPDSLLLRQDQTAFRRGAVDGHNQYGEVRRGQEIADDSPLGFF